MQNFYKMMILVLHVPRWTPSPPVSKLLGVGTRSTFPGTQSPIPHSPQGGRGAGSASSGSVVHGADLNPRLFGDERQRTYPRVNAQLLSTFSLISFICLLLNV